MRYRNERADVLDILQFDSRDGEVLGPNMPRGCFGVVVRCFYSFATSLIKLIIFNSDSVVSADLTAKGNYLASTNNSRY